MILGIAAIKSYKTYKVKKLLCIYSVASNKFVTRKIKTDNKGHSSEKF